MPSVPTQEELKLKASRIYEEIRDESKEAAVLTIAITLLHTWADGACASLQEIKEKADLMAIEARGPVQ